MKKRNVWIYVIAVWTIYFLVNLSFKLSAGFDTLDWILGVSITSISGFIVTIILFRYYQAKTLKVLPLINIFVLVIICSILSAILWLILDHLMSIPLWGIDVILLILKDLFILNALPIFLLHILLFFSISAVYWGWHLIRNLIDQKMRTENAILLAENNRLRLLGMQLNPHFLFNSLSSLRSLIREDQKRAEQMLTKISEFLRYSLESKKETEVPLSQEIESIKNYIEIERTRYGENLETHFDIDPISEDYPVLCFLLHPIIENAVKYGMDTSPMPLTIAVETEMRDHKLIIQIVNSGKWIENQTNDNNGGTGNGLMIVRERLKHSYPDSHRFDITKQNGKVSVLIELFNKSTVENAAEI